jgi:BRCT domain type II-containing protein
MKNPYKVLGLNQDATNSEIVKSQIKALRSRKYTMKEITEAQATLRKPAQRLAADFTFPIFDSVEIEPLTSSTKSKDVNFNVIDPNKYNTLK